MNYKFRRVCVSTREATDDAAPFPSHAAFLDQLEKWNRCLPAIWRFEAVLPPLPRLYEPLPPPPPLIGGPW
jgi:hypothetical protein